MAAADCGNLVITALSLELELVNTFKIPYLH